MGTTTRLSFEDFQKLQDAAEETIRYELDEGELIVTPSPTYRHNLIVLRLWHRLAAFGRKHQLGIVANAIDFRLSANTVLNPDVAFIAKNHLKGFDPDRTPIEGAPTVAAEVISPGNPPQRMLKKAHQYLAAGSQAVWLVYPKKRMIEIHERDGIRRVTEQEKFCESGPFAGHEFLLSLAALFDDNLEE